MLIDCARTAPPARIEADIAIVGSGAAGLTLALALEDSGKRVVLLEAGGERFDKQGQEHYRAAAIAPKAHGPTHLYRRRAFGGTTAIWGGRCIPFDPIDFEDRPWLPHARWPIGYEEVARHYPRALELCRAGAPQFEVAEALVAGVASDDVILDRIERFSEPTNFGRAYRDRLAKSERVTILTAAPVIDIRTSADGGRCLGLTARAESGGEIEIAAAVTVIAAGGIETPRLLLAANTTKSCGLGNESDLVGRFYQAHLEGEVGRIRFLRPAQEVHLDYERAPDGAYCRRYIWLSPEAQRRERLAGLIARPAHANIVDPGHRDPVLSAMYLVKNFILPEYSRKLTSTERRVQADFRARGKRLLVGHAANFVRRPLRLAGFSFDWTRRRVLARRKLPSVVLRDPRNAYPLDINAEQSPDSESRILLGGERDPLGMRRVDVRWRMSADDRDRVARGMRTLQAGFAGSGAAEIDLDGLDDELAEISRIGGHHIGTARMAESASDGVVDRDCQVFGTKGLYVAGAATFATSGFANPTLTIVALALRLADHLKGESKG